MQGTRPINGAVMDEAVHGVLLDDEFQAKGNDLVNLKRKAN